MMNDNREKQNVIKKEYRLPSSDGRSVLHVTVWEPKREIRGILQISHGMIEHIGRYDGFARALAAEGILVAGHDHLGHGKSSRQEDYGFFADQNGDVCVIRDMRRVSRALKKRYPARPYFFLGHSMGSFFLRKYLMVYGRDGDGAVIMGTGDEPLPVLLAGMTAVSLTGRIRGWRYRSSLLHNLVLGSFDRKFKEDREPKRWISGDRKKVQEYQKDPMCQFIFTCSAYRDLFKIMLDLKSCFWLSRMPENLPVLLLSGDQDPVGNQGRGVKRVYKKMKKRGVLDVTVRLYPGCRHELLNETNRRQVYQDILAWIDRRILLRQGLKTR